MKQNTNIFIMIGIITLTCGQLHGLTRKQFFQLNQFKKQLDTRYKRGIPGINQADWLKENRKIIEQIRRLDRPTATTYQKKQNRFDQRIRKLRTAKAAKLEIAKLDAERIAKQTGGLTIAVSERRGKISVYYGNSRYVLQDTEQLLRRTTETLQILEKQREIFNELSMNLNILEITNLVSIFDVCAILQRIEMIKKMANIINEYIVELGREGIIVRMRMKELTKGIEQKEEFIVRDYSQKFNKVRQFFDNLSFDGLLDVENISRLLFGELSETKILPRGYRILDKTSLNANEIRNLVNNFKNLEEIFNADENSLKRIIKNHTESFKKELDLLKEQILMGKKI